MVVSAIMQIAAAAPIGALFGLAYGTSIRVGYEIIFPALFGDKEVPKDATAVLGKMSTTFTALGGLEAMKFGIVQGIKKSLKDIEADPELVELIKKNSYLDTQNITVNLSGTGLVDDLGRVTSLPPTLNLSDIAKRDITNIQEAKRYKIGDAQCAQQYGALAKISTDGLWCILPDGKIRSIDDPGSRTFSKEDEERAEAEERNRRAKQEQIGSTYLGGRDEIDSKPSSKVFREISSLLDQIGALHSANSGLSANHSNRIRNNQKIKILNIQIKRKEVELNYFLSKGK